MTSGASLEESRTSLQPAPIYFSLSGCNFFSVKTKKKTRTRKISFFYVVIMLLLSFTFSERLAGDDREPKYFSRIDMDFIDRCLGSTLRKRTLWFGPFTEKKPYYYVDNSRWCYHVTIFYDVLYYAIYVIFDLL